MAKCPYMVKTLKNLLQNQESFGAEHRRFKVYQVCSNDGRRLNFDLFTARSDFTRFYQTIHLYPENFEKLFSQNVLKTNG